MPANDAHAGPGEGPQDEPTTWPWEPQPTDWATDAADADHPDLLGAARSTDPRICPFLRLERDGELLVPREVVSDGHLCVAFGDPRPQSERQQELLCLQAAHSNCARYLRGVAKPEAVSRAWRIPRATVAAVLVLLASVGFSFGFVLQRGGLELTGFQLPTGSTASSGAAPSATGGVPAAPSDVAGLPSASRSTIPAATATVAPSLGPTLAPSASLGPAPSATPGPTPTASPVATPVATPTASPVATPLATPAATAQPTPRRTATPRPTSDRFAVITRCPGRSDCWIYTVRRGDNLFSIAHWFGVSLDRVYAMNPWARLRGVHPGNDLLIPTPTR